MQYKAPEDICCASRATATLLTQGVGLSRYSLTGMGNDLKLTGMDATGAYASHSRVVLRTSVVLLEAQQCGGWIVHLACTHPALCYLANACKKEASRCLSCYQKLGLTHSRWQGLGVNTARAVALNSAPRWSRYTLSRASMRYT